MTLHLGNVDAGSTLYIPFQTFDSNGASVTLSGLAVTDIEIFKNGSTTQRASDNGYALLDTDGIDFDGITGIHGFSIDLSDNSDAGFYSAGAFYWVVISAVTVDTRTVNFVAATFRIGPVAANATQILGTAISTPATAGILDVNVKNMNNVAATPITTIKAVQGLATDGVVPTVTNLTNAPTNGDLTASMKASVNAEVDTALADYDAPTHAELTAELATADDATLAAIAGLNDISAADVLAAADITPIAANIKKVNDVGLQGDGSATPWGPV